MQIETTMTYYLTPVQMVIIKIIIISTGEAEEKNKLLYTVGGNVNQHSHYENSMEVSQKQKIKSTV